MRYNIVFTKQAAKDYEKITQSIDKIHKMN